MNNIKIIFTFLTYCLFLNLGFSQIDMLPNTIGVNVSNSVSEIGVNDVGNTLTSLYVQADENSNGSIAIHGRPFATTGLGDNTTGVFGGGIFGDQPISIYGLRGFSYRDSPYNNGRNAGVRGDAGNATPGANYGGFFILNGSNAGTGVLGYDAVNYPGWNEVLLPNVSYAGYFRGKGFFYDNVGIGPLADNPKSKLHITNGDIYVEGSVNGVILEDGSGGCHKITVDPAGTLIVSLVTCPN